MKEPSPAPASNATANPYLLENHSVLSTSAAPSGNTPAQTRRAYGFDLISFERQVADGSGQTIAIVAYGASPAPIVNDVQKFSGQFGLPPVPSLKIVDIKGGNQFPAIDIRGAMAASANVEWAHAIAPGANILVVVAPSDSQGDLMRAIDFAKVQPGVSVILNTWSMPEFATESTVDSQHFSGISGMTLIAAGRDNGGQGVITSYPAISACFLSIGGTVLTRDSSGVRLSESAWTGSAGGGSMNGWQKRPVWQNGLPIYQWGPTRLMPDFSLDAAPATGYAVYYNNQWNAVAGSGQSAAVAAGLVAIINQGRALAGNLPIDGPTQLLPQLYGPLKSDFYDITTGHNSMNAVKGYDMATGLGTPQAAKLVADLSGFSVTTLTASANPAIFGQAVTLTASVTPIAQGVWAPTGTVRLKDGSTLLGSVPLAAGKAAVTTSALSAGSHSITFEYLGDANFRAKTSAVYTQSVKIPTTTNLTASSTTPRAGTPVDFSVNVVAASSVAGTPTGSAVLKDGTTTVGTVNLVNGAGTVTTSKLIKGKHSLTYEFQGSDQFFPSNSSALVVTVQ